MLSSKNGLEVCNQLFSHPTAYRKLSRPKVKTDKFSQLYIVEVKTIKIVLRHCYATQPLFDVKLT